MKRVLCFLQGHQWKPLLYKTLDSFMRDENGDLIRVRNTRITEEYCIRCGKKRKLIDFEGKIHWR